MQVKTTRRFHCPLKWLKSNSPDNPTVLVMRVQQGTVPLGNGLAISYKVEHTLIARARNPTSGDLQKEIKTCVRRKIWAQVFTVLFINHHNLEAAREPFIEGCRSMHTVGKRKKLFTSAAQRSLTFIS